ncbi:hypothetical protein G6Z25_01890 [Clostridium perfringens]|uniref:hypothetical protein n=1 Tax=Clostridium perfringens TaxID=1502 RepID=UPI0013E2E392|nr:hypothetical protein [Clostridium perfringens]NGS95669.1 hypothetical protein [Clostridium perfringens]
MVAKYFVGYIYNGEDVGWMKPFKTLKEAEKFIKDEIGDEEITDTLPWEESNGIRIKHYYTSLNCWFISDVRNAKYEE